MRNLIPICAAVIISACASAPERTADVKGPATETSASLAAAPAPTDDQPAEAAAADKAFAHATAKSKLVVRNGQSLYCHHERALGSRLPVEICLTEEQVRASIQESQANRDKLRLPGGAPCGSALLTCGG